MTTIDTGARALLRATAHDVAGIVARDGADIAVRVTSAAGAERGVLFFHNGTAAAPVLFDGMAARLATSGITSYSVGARTLVDDGGRAATDLGHGIHADDLARVIDFALATGAHAGIPAAVSGSSFGAVVAMHYNAVANPHGLPVLALNPVMLDRFLPFGDKLTLAASLVSDAAAAKLVATPMSRGVPLSTNQASRYVANAGELASTRVPAAVFRDVARMNLETMAKGRVLGRATGELQVALAGADEVAINASVAPLELLSAPSGKRLPTITFEGAAHDLSQAFDRSEVVRNVERFVTDRGVPLPTG